MSQWIDAAAAADVPTDDVIGVQVRGLDIALYGVDGEVFATDNRCPHGEGRFCDGFVLGHEVECPLHQGRIDVRDGRPTCEPIVEPVRVYPVRVEDGRVLLRID